MKCFENSDGKGDVVIYLDRKEAITIIEMAEEAVKANKRKTSYKNISKKLNSELACF